MKVRWREFARDLLADIVVVSDLARQDEIERAVLRIDGALAKDPWNLGESRGTPTRRSWSVEPITVLFDIVENLDEVVVLHVAARRLK